MDTTLLLVGAAVSGVAWFAVPMVFPGRKQDVYRHMRWQALSLVWAVLPLLAGSVAAAVPAALVFALTLSRGVWGTVSRPQEAAALVQFLLTHTVPTVPKGLSDADAYTYRKLVETSRSFSAVILHLHAKLRTAVAAFYVVCRAIDTIEDDMAPPVDAKVAQLRAFSTRLAQPGWNLDGFGEKAHEKELLQNFDKVIATVQTLSPAYQEVIRDIAHKMANGMADFLTKPVVSLPDYDLYCYYVAGVVGEGLSRLFAISELEDKSFATAEKLWMSMGLFLQKTNITRDYLEDVTAAPPRLFWPRAIWGQFTQDVTLLHRPEHRGAAMATLNAMIANAMLHAEDCLDFLDKLREPSVFAFCAIPQVMAISTLALCYNNPEVFTKEVKIRKSEAVLLMTTSTTMGQVLRHFAAYATQLEADIPAGDPSAAAMRTALQSLRTKCTAHPRFSQ